jgi:hypothetical protein
MSKRLVLTVVLVIVWAGIAAAAMSDIYVGFNTGEDGAAYVTGNFNGTGSAINGWSSNWNVTTGFFQVVTGGPEGDQSVFFSKATATEYANRGIVAGWTAAEDFSLTVYLNAKGLDRWYNAAELMFRGSGGDADRNLDITIGKDGLLSVNNASIMNLNSLDDGLVEGIDSWAKLGIEYTAATTTYDVYWENASGGMTLVGSVDHHRDNYFSGEVKNIKWGGPRLLLLSDQGTSGIGWDALTIVPEPVTVALLGLGGLALIRRKRQ